MVNDALDELIIDHEKLFFILMTNKDDDAFIKESFLIHVLAMARLRPRNAIFLVVLLSLQYEAPYFNAVDN